jgi:glucosamine--fructose-6-phosphate aminotransferase (isomerizing)
VAVDGDTEEEVLIVKQVGKVAALRKLIDEQKVDFGKTFISHCSMVSTKKEYPRKAVYMESHI